MHGETKATADCDRESAVACIASNRHARVFPLMTVATGVFILAMKLSSEYSCLKKSTARSHERLSSVESILAMLTTSPPAQKLLPLPLSMTNVASSESSHFCVLTSAVASAR